MPFIYTYEYSSDTRLDFTKTRTGKHAREAEITEEQEAILEMLVEFSSDLDDVLSSLYSGEGWPKQ